MLPPLAVYPLPHIRTGDAIAFSVRHHPEIVTGKWMAALAVRFSKIHSCYGVASQRVVSWRCWNKMIRVYAAAIVANMVKLFSFWNRANESLMGEAVSQFLCLLTRVSLSLDAKVAVAIRGNSSCPYPTRASSPFRKRYRAILVNFCPEAFKRVLSSASLHGVYNVSIAKSTALVKSLCGFPLKVVLSWA